MKNFLVPVFCLLACPGVFVFAQNPNIALRAKMTFTGQTLANVWGHTAPDGREYALVGASQGLVIVEVTNPDTPRQIVQIPGPNNLWKEIKTFRNYAYVVSEGGQGVQIVNLAGLPSANLPSRFFTGQGPNAGQLNRIHALHIDVTKGFLYLYGSNLNAGAPTVFDLNADPWNPTYAGAFTALGYVHDGFVDNDTLYSGHIYAGQFAIVDMTNKAAPQLLATQTTPNAFTHNTWPSADRRTLFTTDETANSFLAAYDISDPENIRLLDKIQSNPGGNSAVHNTHIVNDFAVTSWYKDGVTIVDVSRPDNLVQTGNYDTYAGAGSGYEGCWGVFPFFPSGTLVATNIKSQGTQNGELFILTPTYQRACHLEGTVTDAATGAVLNSVKVDILGTSPLQSETTTLTGDYKMGRATGGYFTVRFTKNGYQTAEKQVFMENGALTVLNVPMFPFGSITVSGLVKTGRDGLPVNAATVHLFGPGVEHATVTETDGSFAFFAVSPGEYDIAAGDAATGKMALLHRQGLARDTSICLNLVPGHRRGAGERAAGFGGDFWPKKSPGVFAGPNPFVSETVVFGEDFSPGRN